MSGKKKPAKDKTSRTRAVGKADLKDLAVTKWQKIKGGVRKSGGSPPEF